jgi:hypothetical protein
MTTTWQPSIELPAQWGALRFEKHPSELHEGVNMAATLPPALAGHVFETLPRNISLAQAEAVALCCRALSVESDGGFWIGDATGVGKGRTIGAIIGERTARPNSLAVWVTSSKLLHGEAMRDLGVTTGIALEREITDCVHQLVSSPAQFRVLLTTYRSISDPAQRHALTFLLNTLSGSTTVIFDEAHAARNADSGCGKVVYSTATAASSVHNMGYMTRLGLWGPGKQCSCYAKFVEKFQGRGVAILELIALDLKRRGKYIARTLQQGIDSVSMKQVVLSPEQEQLYTRCCDFWSTWCQGNRGSRLRFFKLLGTALKTPDAIRRSRKHLAAGHSVIITLQRTCSGHDTTNVFFEEMMAACTDPVAARDELEALLPHLPSDPLRQLLSGLAEYGIVELSGRATPKVMRKRMAEFQQGDARVAVTTSAASQGISLHSSSHGARRVHLILELPWSAELFTQQCGRSSRTGQLELPEYELLVSNLTSEARFTNTLVTRLQQMGAITRGDAATEYVGVEELAGHSMASRTSRLRLVMQLLITRTVIQAVHARFGTTLSEFSATFDDAMLRDATRDLMDAHWRDHMSTLTQVRGNYGTLGAITFLVYGVLGETFATCSELVLAAAARGAGTILRRYPLATVPGSWAPAVHFRYPAQIRNVVMTTMLCARRQGCPLHVLPTEALELVCRFVADADVSKFGSDDEMPPLLESMVRCEGARGFLTIDDTKTMFNAYVAVPPKAQAGMWKVMGQATSFNPISVFGRGQVGVVGLRDFLLGSRAADMDVQCDVQRLGPPDPNDIRIRFTVRHVPPPDPIDTWVEGRTLRAIGMTLGSSSEPSKPFAIIESTRATSKGRLQMWYPGRVFACRTGAGGHTILNQVAIKNVRWLVEGEVCGAEWRSLWDSHRTKHHAKRAAIAATMAGEVEALTERALDSVIDDDSSVLRCAPPCVPTPFTCLVRSVSRTW